MSNSAVPQSPDSPVTRQTRRWLAPSVTVAAMAAVSVGAVALVAVFDGDSIQGGQSAPPKLAEQFVMETAADSRSGSAPVQGTQPHPQVRGALPDQPEEGVVRTFSDGPAPAAKVSALADALELPGTPEHGPAGWTLAHPDGLRMLTVSDQPGWHWMLGAPVTAEPAPVDDGAVACVPANCIPPVLPMPPAAGTGQPAAPPASKAIPSDDPAGSGHSGTAPSSGGAGSSGSSGTVAGPNTGTTSSNPDLPTSSPERPTKPGDGPLEADTPDADAALRTAEPILSALDMGGSPTRVTTGPGFARVSVDPEVAGLPTVGVESYLMLDSELAVIEVGGWLAPTQAGHTYPLDSATEVLDRIRPTVGCESCQPGPAITGGRYGLMLHSDAEGMPLLAPAWLYDIEGTTTPLALLAVTPEHTGSTTPDGAEPGTSRDEHTAGPAEPAREPADKPLPLGDDEMPDHPARP